MEDIKNNLDDSINNILNNYSFSENQERTKIFKVIKYLVGIDQKVSQEVQKNKKEKKCFSHVLCEDFCKGTEIEINKPELSHVVADNQLKKFQDAYGVIYKKSFKLYDKLSTEIKLVESTQAPVFVGFCKSCEKDFTNASSLDIDTEINYTKNHMIKSLYRFLGKEISWRDEYLKAGKLINNGKNKEILPEDYNLFYKRLYQNSAIEHIQTQTFYRNFFKSLELDLGTFLYCKHNIPLLKPPTGEIYHFMEVTVPSDEFQIVGQSISTVPIHFTDSNIVGFFYFNFIYDEINKKTKCYMLTSKYLWEHITKKQKLMLGSKQKALLLLILCFINNNELYFTKNFYEKFSPYLKKYYSEVPNVGMEVQLEFLLNRIKMEKL